MAATTTFQNRFNRLFEEAELSQEEFGASIGASRFQVYNWRSGRGEPDSEMMKTIAGRYEVSVAWLLGETDVRGGVASLTDAPLSGELLSLLRRLERLPEEDRKEIESYIQFKEHLSKDARSDDAVGK